MDVPGHLQQHVTAGNTATSECNGPQVRTVAYFMAWECIDR